MTTLIYLKPGTYQRGTKCPACHHIWHATFTVADGDTVTCSCGVVIPVKDWPDRTPLTKPAPAPSNVQRSRWPSARAIVWAVLVLFYLIGYVIAIVWASGPGRAKAGVVAIDGTVIPLILFGLALLVDMVRLGLR